jgi:hypothetical protein
LAPTPVPWKKLNCITNWFAPCAHLRHMKETQLYYELNHSWCQPLSREINSINCIMNGNWFALVASSGAQKKLLGLSNWFALGAHLCPPWSKETKCLKQLFRSRWPPLLTKERRNWIPWSTIHSWSTLKCPPLPHKHKRYTILCQICLLWMPASGAQKPLNVLTKLSFLMPTSAPQAPKNTFLGQADSLLVPVSAAENKN